MPSQGGEKMSAVWAQRQAELLNHCVVSPDVFDRLVDRLHDFAQPYQQCLETEAGKRNMALYLEGLMSHLDRKNAEKIAALVDVERLVMQAFIGTASWEHRPLVQVLVGQVADRLGEPDGVIAFDPSSVPKRGTHAVGVKRQWCGHRGKVDNCQVGVFMGYVSRHDHALLDFRLSLPEAWARDPQRRQECHVPQAVRYQTRHDQCLEMLDAWGEQVPHGWVVSDDELGRHTRYRHELRAWRTLCAGGALHHDDARPGGAVACVSRAWTAAESPLAIGKRVAPLTRPGRVDAVDGARRGERPSGDRHDHTPRADPPRTQTDGTRRVVGRHPSPARGRQHVGAPASRDASDQDARHRYRYYFTPTQTTDSELAEPSLAELARVIKAGVCIEASFQRGKSEAGMDAYQVRTWEGWHHHMALTLISVWFLICETHRGQQVTPALTLPQVRYSLSVLLMAVFCTLSIPSICRQVQRQLVRNELARFYHYCTRKCLPKRKLRRDIQ
jgi:SRSO17 transposase